MSEQRIDTGADAATSTDADPSEGLGVADPAAHTDPLNPRGTAGGDAEMPQPSPDRTGGSDADSASTEGASYLQETQRTAEAQQRRDPDLSGREPAASAGGAAGDSGASGGSGGQPAGGGRATAETGEVSAAPSPERRAEDPGSVSAEFADRADTAPDSGPAGDIAHPTI